MKETAMDINEEANSKFSELTEGEKDAVVEKIHAKCRCDECQKARAAEPKEPTQ